MTADEAIQAAKETLGANKPDDYLIQPTKHEAELAQTAPALAGILRHSDVNVIAAQYEKKDGEANENRTLFEETASRANWAVLLTACFSTLLLVATPLSSLAGTTPNKYLVALLGVCGVISGAFGSMWLYRAREGKLLDNWMSARAGAEDLRRQYFETVTCADCADAGSQIPPALLQFEYFRRYQLDVQTAFYERRGNAHRRDANRLLWMSSYSVVLASIGAELAAVLSGLNPAWLALGALGTVATALAAFAATKESVNQSRRNAELYSNTGDALVLLEAKLDAVRAAAVGGEREPVKQFVAAVHDQLAAEHRQWLKAGESIQPAIEKLDETLKAVRQKPKEEQATAGIGK